MIVMEYVFHIIVFVWIYLILAASLNLIAGYAGMMSVAHAAFFGIGAYCTGILSLNLGTPFVLNVTCSALTAWFVASVIAYPTARIRDDYFVIATLAFQVIAYSTMLNLREVTGGAMGLPGIPQPSVLGVMLNQPWHFAVLGCVVGGTVLLLCRRVATSPVGRVLKGIREDETYVCAMGKDIVRLKVSVFSLSAAIAAVSGGIYATYITFIDPSSFTLMESVFIICIVIVGGSGSFWGPVVGAVLLVTLPELLRLLGLPSSISGNIRQLLYGGMLVAFMLLRPGGIAGDDVFGKDESQ